MATKSKKKRLSGIENKFKKLDTLTLENLLCSICQSIFVEPVILPCFHAFCQICFIGSIQNNALCCPLCRLRVGSWIRNTTKQKNIVNQELWDFIKTNYKNELATKYNGEDLDLPEELPQHKLSAPGEIRLEYQIELNKHKIQKELEEKRNLLQSQELIKKLQEEDERYLNDVKQDEILAHKLYQELIESKSEKSPLKKSSLGILPRIVGKNEATPDINSISIPQLPHLLDITNPQSPKLHKIISVEDTVLKDNSKTIQTLAKSNSGLKDYGPTEKNNFAKPELSESDVLKCPKININKIVQYFKIIHKTNSHQIKIDNTTFLDEHKFDINLKQLKITDVALGLSKTDEIKYPEITNIIDYSNARTPTLEELRTNKITYLGCKLLEHAKIGFNPILPKSKDIKNLEEPNNNNKLRLNEQLTNYDPYDCVLFSTPTNDVENVNTNSIMKPDSSNESPVLTDDSTTNESPASVIAGCSKTPEYGPGYGNYLKKFLHNKILNVKELWKKDKRPTPFVPNEATDDVTQDDESQSSTHMEATQSLPVSLPYKGLLVKKLAQNIGTNSLSEDSDSSIQDEVLSFRHITPYNYKASEQESVVAAPIATRAVREVTLPQVNDQPSREQYLQKLCELRIISLKQNLPSAFVIALKTLQITKVYTRKSPRKHADASNSETTEIIENTRTLRGRVVSTGSIPKNINERTPKKEDTKERKVVSERKSSLRSSTGKGQNGCSASPSPAPYPNNKVNSVKKKLTSPMKEYDIINNKQLEIEQLIKQKKNDLNYAVRVNAELNGRPRVAGVKRQTTLKHYKLRPAKKARVSA